MSESVNPPANMTSPSTSFLSPKRIILIVILIVLGNMLIYSFIYTYVNKVGFIQEGWKMITGLKVIPLGEAGAITYVMGATILSLEPHSITVEKEGKQDSFRMPLTKFTVTAPFNNIYEWPAKIITANDRTQFKAGDKVTLLITGDRFAPIQKESFFLQRVIKIQE